MAFCGQVEGGLLLPVVLWDSRGNINVWAEPDMVWLWFVSRLVRALSLSDISSVEPALTASWLCLALSAPLFPWGVWRSLKRISPCVGSFLLVLPGSHLVPWNVGAQTMVSFAGVKLVSFFSCFCGLNLMIWSVSLMALEIRILFLSSE